jgi:hypothetical protein
LIEITSFSKPPILSRVQFTQNQHFCCFAPITLPCSIRIKSLNSSARSSLVPFVGISNLATTCYAAATLQFILTATPFVELIFRTQCGKDTICSHLQKVFADLLFSENPLQIRHFVSSFGSKSHELATEEQMTIRSANNLRALATKLFQSLPNVSSFVKRPISLKTQKKLQMHLFLLH